MLQAVCHFAGDETHRRGEIISFRRMLTRAFYGALEMKLGARTLPRSLEFEIRARIFTETICSRSHFIQSVT